MFFNRFISCIMGAGLVPALLFGTLEHEYFLTNLYMKHNRRNTHAHSASFKN
jgi:hypothetical protein